jgi:methionyl-tRNA synthetase
MINIDDFGKVEIRVGKILSAEKVPDTDKLLKLSVDMGEEQPRQIVSGIALYFPEPQSLVGIKCTFVANLEPRTIRGLESQGMIMGVNTPNNEDGTPGVFSLLKVSEDIPAGTKVK